VSLLAAAASRLGRQDMLQGLTALLAALCLVLAMSWPGGGSVVNESWSVVAPLRATLLAFGALAWGASVGARPRRDEMGPSYVPLPESPPHGEPAWRREVGATLAALLAMGVITMPFDVLSHAASYPRTGLGWSLAAPFLATGGYFGLGLGMGRLTRVAGLGALLPLAVPAVVAGAAWLDVSLGTGLASPWFAALVPSPLFAAAMAALTALALWTARPVREVAA